MNEDWKMELYWRLPVFLQESALSIYARYLDGIYYANGYEEWRRRFGSWQDGSDGNIVAWQNEQLQRIIS